MWLRLRLMNRLPLTHPSGFPSMSCAPANSIVEDLKAALAQWKFARCPHSLAASSQQCQSGSDPSMSLIPFAPFAEIEMGFNPLRFESQRRAYSASDAAYDTDRQRLSQPVAQSISKP